jgi:hypothetical protein
MRMGQDRFQEVFFKRFDRGNCSNRGLIVPKSKKTELTEGRIDESQPFQEPTLFGEDNRIGIEPAGLIITLVSSYLDRQPSQD